MIFARSIQQISTSACCKLFLLSLIACLGAVSTVAQSVSGTITGFVKDPQGGVIVSAMVAARSAQTGAVVSTRSGEDGYYRLQSLVPGEHIIEISALGFQTSISSPQ